MPPHDPLPARRVSLKPLTNIVTGPLTRFLKIESASSIVLMVAAAFALIWANSTYAHAYHALWGATLPFPIAVLPAPTLHVVVNDALMAFFFLVVGLEIRREIHEGELADMKRATLPLVAALGGMVVPALLFLAINPSGPASNGWGTPMATDIAFAVGALSLLGSRVPAGLRILLLALAVIDDVGGILVIALFYSQGIEPLGLAAAAAAAAAIVLMQRIGVRSPWLYLLPGSALWFGMHYAGIHPALAGVALGLMTPAVGTRGRAPPTTTIVAALHSWIAYLVMPVFALANAGVTLNGLDFESPGALEVMLGVGGGLLLGKPIGILAACYLAVRLRVCELPRGVTFGGVAVVGIVAGVGFTVAIFVANLAFPDPAQLAMAKLGVLAGSVLAGFIGLLVGRTLPQPDSQVASVSLEQAERTVEF